MQSGKLRSVGQLQRSIDGTWTHIKDIYLNASFTGGGESLDSETGYASTNAEFATRRDTSITTKDRIIYETRTFYIESIIPDRTDRRRQVMNCIERNF